MTKTQGFSLIELLSCCAIASLLLGISAPSLKHIEQKYRARHIALTLHQSLTRAREIAVINHSRVILCGSQDGISCNKEKITYLISFIDENKDYKASPSEKIILNIKLTDRRDRLHLAASLGRNYITFNSDGSARQAGSFIYCPSDGNLLFARRITVSMTGRPYIAIDNNEDNIVELTSGAPIAC